jgi:hypothetical protein
MELGLASKKLQWEEFSTNPCLVVAKRRARTKKL